MDGKHSLGKTLGKELFLLLFVSVMAVPMFLTIPAWGEEQDAMPLPLVGPIGDSQKPDSLIQHPPAGHLASSGLVPEDASLLDRYFGSSLSGYDLKAESPPSRAPGVPKLLTNGITVTGILNGTGESELWCINVTEGARSMRVVLTCPYEPVRYTDFDLYGRLNSYPTNTTYDWSAHNFGDDEIETKNPASGTWFILVFSWRGKGTYQLSVTVLYTRNVKPLTSGTAVIGTLNVTADSDLWYIDVPTGATSMQSTLTCPAGADFDLYANRGSYPTMKNYSWRSLSGGGESLSYSYPSPGRWYIMPYSYRGNGTYQLNVDVFPGVSTQYLYNGAPVIGSLAATGNYDLWYISVGSGATNMHSVLTCPQGADFDLYGKYGSAPSTIDYYWRASMIGGEDIDYSYPSSGYWYIMVRAMSGNGSYQLTVTISYGSGGQPSLSGIALPVIVLFTIIFIFIALAAPRRGSSSSWSGSTNRSPHIPREEVVAQETRTRAVAPRLVQCKRCGASMRVGEDYCWNCGAGAKGSSKISLGAGTQAAKRMRSGICMVCKRGLEKSDEILFCPYCGGLAHKDHMLEWLHVKDYCPSCGRHLDEGEVNKQTRG